MKFKNLKNQNINILVTKQNIVSIIFTIFFLVVRVEFAEWVIVTLLHDAVKVLKGDKTVPSSVSFANNLMQLIIANALTDLCSNLAQVFERNAAGVVLVKELKDFENLLARGLVTETWRDNLEELLEIKATT